MTEQPEETAAESVAETVDPTTESSSILSQSAVMAAGTTVSRLSGFVRAALLSYALGASVHADVFNVANSLPNMLYILLAGGVFNAVLVPQLVRALRNDPDRGDAYTSRVVTVAGLFLVAVTVLLVLAAPLLVRPRRTELRRRGSRLRDRVHAALPAAGLLLRDVRAGRADPQRPRLVRPDDVGADRQQRDRRPRRASSTSSATARPTARRSLRPYTTGQELLLGIGSTLGIAIQLLILVPYLRRAGFAYRPRLDLRGSGLGHTLRLGIWTVLFVVVNQVAYVVVQRLATSGATGSEDGTGFTVYSFSFLVVMVPHSIVTVSLATAMLPRLSAHAAAERPAGAGRVAVEHPARRARGHRPVRRAAAGDRSRPRATSSSRMAPRPRTGSTPTCRRSRCSALGILFFTFHYLVLRGFYALELNRTVFFVQCVVAATNIVAAIALVARTSAEHTSPALVRRLRGLLRRGLGRVLPAAAAGCSAGCARDG